MDFSPQCIEEVKKKTRRGPTAVGTVSLTPQDQLNFESHAGEFKAVWLKKYFATMRGGIKEVLVDPLDEEGAAAPVKEFKLATPPAGKFVRAVAAQPTAPQPTVNAPQVSRPTTATPARPPDRPPTNISLPLPERATDQETLVETYITRLRTADLPIKDPGKKNVLDKAEQLSGQGEYAHALQLLNGLVRDVKYPGVEAWALQTPTRKNEVELLTEQLVGFQNLIVHGPQATDRLAKAGSGNRALIERDSCVQHGHQRGAIFGESGGCQKVNE